MGEKYLDPVTGAIKYCDDHKLTDFEAFSDGTYYHCKCGEESVFMSQEMFAHIAQKIRPFLTEIRVITEYPSREIVNYD